MIFAVSTRLQRLQNRPHVLGGQNNTTWNLRGILFTVVTGVNPLSPARRLFVMPFVRHGRGLHLHCRLRGRRVFLYPIGQKNAPKRHTQNTSTHARADSTGTRENHADGLNPFATGNRFLGTLLLGLSIGRGFRALKGFNALHCPYLRCSSRTPPARPSPRNRRRSST